MSEFNFSSLATTQVSSTHKPVLKPWKIYEVTFEGARKETVKGKKDPDKVYEILKVRFENNQGYYEESIFFPREGDDKRPIYKNKEGHEYEGASTIDRIMTFIAQVAGILNPEGFKKMQTLSSKFRTFDDVVKAFIAITDPVKGKAITHLKLIGKSQKDGSVISGLPRFVAVNKNGERFTSDNFIGEDLFFSPYEEKKKEEYLNASPTTMPDNDTSKAIAENIDGGNKGSEDIDFEGLL